MESHPRPEPLYLSYPFLLLSISILPVVLQSKLCLLPSYISWSLYSPYLLIAYHITLPPSIYCIKFADSVRHITGSILIYQELPLLNPQSHLVLIAALFLPHLT
ncbi:hypothetical protein RU639_002165 [Aspergillus parasiticus]